MACRTSSLMARRLPGSRTASSPSSSSVASTDRYTVGACFVYAARSASESAACSASQMSCASLMWWKRQPLMGSCFDRMQMVFGVMPEVIDRGPVYVSLGAFAASLIISPSSGKLASCARQAGIARPMEASAFSARRRMSGWNACSYSGCTCSNIGTAVASASTGMGETRRRPAWRGGLCGS